MVRCGVTLEFLIVYQAVKGRIYNTGKLNVKSMEHKLDKKVAYRLLYGTRALPVQMKTGVTLR